MSVADDLRMEFTNLEGKVAASGTVVDSAVIAFEGISTAIGALNAEIARLQALVDAGGDPALVAAATEVTARGQALEAQVDASAQKLAAAIPLNTGASGSRRP